MDFYSFLWCFYFFLGVSVQGSQHVGSVIIDSLLQLPPCLGAFFVNKGKMKQPLVLRDLNIRSTTCDLDFLRLSFQARETDKPIKHKVNARTHRLNDDKGTHQSCWALPVMSHEAGTPWIITRSNPRRGGRMDIVPTMPHILTSIYT